MRPTISILKSLLDAGADARALQPIHVFHEEIALLLNRYGVDRVIFHDPSRYSTQQKRGIDWKDPEPESIQPETFGRVLKELSARADQHLSIDRDCCDLDLSQQIEDVMERHRIVETMCDPVFHNGAQAIR